jgi:hypothetical protein
LGEMPNHMSLMKKIILYKLENLLKFLKIIFSIGNQ